MSLDSRIKELFGRPLKVKLNMVTGSRQNNSPANRQGKGLLSNLVVHRLGSFTGGRF
jgi:hypothetical protein